MVEPVLLTLTQLGRKVGEMVPFDGADPAEEHRAMAAKKLSWAEVNVLRAQEAFRMLTGKSPLDAQDEWLVFWKATWAAGDPSADLTKWIAHAVKPFRATEGVRKARILAVLWALNTDPKDHLGAKNYRGALGRFDPLFNDISLTKIEQEFAPLWARRERRPPVSVKEADGKTDLRGWFEAIAACAVHVGALGTADGRPDRIAKQRGARKLAKTLSENFRTYRALL